MFVDEKIVKKLEVLDVEDVFKSVEVDTRFKKLVAKFVHFLRNEGFNISIDAVLKFFKLYNEFNIFEINDMKYSLKMLLCKNKEQYYSFEECFEAFFYGLYNLNKEKSLENEIKRVGASKIAPLERIKKQKEKEFEEYSKRVSVERDEELKKVEKSKKAIDDKRKEFIENIDKKIVSVEGVRRKKEKDEEKLKEWCSKNRDKLESLVSSCNFEDNKIKKEDILDGLSLSQEKMLEILKDDSSVKMEEFTKVLNEVMLENMIGENNSIINNLCIAASSIMSKSKKLMDKRLKERENRLNKFNEELQKEDSKIASLDARIKNKSNKMLQEIQSYKNKVSTISKNIEKEIVSQHRDVFLEGKNSVKLLNPQNELLDKRIQRLSNAQYESLSEVIKANASRFKTKISRSMVKDKSKKFNYRKTLQNSMKTYGVPMELCYEKPKIKKTKIICILDVSGSCSKAARVLLRFIYELSTVFKGGVKSYAFVGDLADISDLFIDYDIDTASELALKSVPRVYSNYYKALSMFNDEYLGEVDKNTIVIFLGDARNNSNKPGVEFIEIIQKRAKSVFWLNTEEKVKWDVNDSVIGLYSEYVDEVREILTTNDIVDFLESVKIN